jgi:hypothetical protein
MILKFIFRLRVTLMPDFALIPQPLFPIEEKGSQPLKVPLEWG